MLQMSETISDAYIFKLWDICFKAYLQHGYKLSFPHNTDPKRTYHWKYLKSIAVKFNRWEFDEATIIRFIDIAVKRVKYKQLLCKGLSALHQKNLFDLVYKDLMRENEESARLIEIIESSRKYLLSKLNSGTSRKELVKALLTREKFNKSYAITNAFMSKKITKQYMALSYSCNKSISFLKEKNDGDTILLPSLEELYVERCHLLSRDAGFVCKLTEILQNDWRSM